MYDVSVPNYLVIIMPMLLCLFSLQSIVLYHKIYVSYIIPISIVAMAFSLFFYQRWRNHLWHHLWCISIPAAEIRSIMVYYLMGSIPAFG